MATALADAGVDRFAIKCALNHRDNSVTGIYDRSQHMRRKAYALDEWYALIESKDTAEFYHLKVMA